MSGKCGRDVSKENSYFSLFLSEPDRNPWNVLSTGPGRPICLTSLMSNSMSCIMGKEINKLVDAQSSSEIPKHNQSIIKRVRQYLGQTNCKNSFHIILFILQRSPAGERSKKKKKNEKVGQTE